LVPDKLDELGLDNRSSAACLRGHGRGRTTHLLSRAVGFGLALADGWRVVPFLAGREASHHLAVLVHAEVSEAVVLVGRTGAQ